MGGGERQAPIALGDVGTLLVPADAEEVARERIVPALEPLLIAAVEREALMREVVETDALRRSDEIKTAVLRSVSHDLRSPLTAIRAMGEALGSARARGVRARRAGRGDHGGERAAVTARGPADRPVAVAGGDGGAGPGLVLAGRGDPRRNGGQRGVCRAGTARRRSRPAACPGGRGAAAAGACESDRERAPLRRQRAGLGSRARERWSRPDPRRRPRAGDPAGRAGADLRAVLPCAGSGRPGSGLGLAIVRGFVEANGGRVRVESLPGQGTSFVVELPLPEGAPLAGALA